MGRWAAWERSPRCIPAAAAHHPPTTSRPYLPPTSRHTAPCTRPPPPCAQALRPHTPNTPTAHPLRADAVAAVGQAQALQRQVAPRLQQLPHDAVGLGEVPLQQQHPPPALPLVEGKGGARHASTDYDHVPHLRKNGEFVAGRVGGGMPWRRAVGRAGGRREEVAGGRGRVRHNMPMHRPCMHTDSLPVLPC